MKPLPEILKQVKSSAAVRLLEKDVKDLNENFEDIMEYLKNRIRTNTNQKTAAIKIDTRPCNVVANAGRKDQAQHLLSIPSIDQIKPSFSNTLKVPKRKTFGFVDCCILPNGNVLTLDEDHKSLLMFRNNGTFIRSILSFKKQPYSVCFVKDDTVAVSFYTACEVAIVDIGKNKVDRNFKFPKVYCSGVSSDGQVL
ncbi:unnamed protein product [Mytilus edulis]|uniref:Uncharacterized protein n=1 Tax=Mytilus edulis TaxID=6550 RepID=A0A8S3Q696_MYTED|nr:unnamed protein product [Mytilus edulis]